jgi:hypothetical protein
LLCATIFAVSLLMSMQAAGKNTSSYFLLHFRAFELVIGAALNLPTLKRLQLSNPISILVVLTGLILILASALMLEKHSPFPGMNALFPCLGAALVLLGGQTQNPISALLATKPTVTIGLLSYSIYLWHWPIFAYLRHLQIAIDPLVIIEVFFATLVLAILTRRFVEVPARKKYVFGALTTIVVLYVAPALLVSIIAAGAWHTKGYPQRFSENVREIAASYSAETDLSRKCSTQESNPEKIDFKSLAIHCQLGTSEVNPKVLLVGDSHANHLRQFFGVLASQAGLGGIYQVQGGCSVDQGADPKGSACQKRNAQLLENVQNYHIVILAGAWNGKLNLNQKNLVQAVQRTIEAGAIPVLVKDVPLSDIDRSKCAFRQKIGWLKSANDCRIPPETHARSAGAANQIIDEIAEAFPETRVIDITRLLCDPMGCKTYIENIAIYRDSNHLNATASRLLGEKYLNLFGNPLVSP